MLSISLKRSAGLEESSSDLGMSVLLAAMADKKRAFPFQESSHGRGGQKDSFSSLDARRSGRSEATLWPHLLPLHSSSSSPQSKIKPPSLKTSRVHLAGAEGLDPSTKVLETHVLPLHHTPKHLFSIS